PRRDRHRFGRGRHSAFPSDPSEHATRGPCPGRPDAPDRSGGNGALCLELSGRTPATGARIPISKPCFVLRFGNVEDGSVTSWTDGAVHGKTRPRIGRPAVRRGPAAVVRPRP